MIIIKEEIPFFPSYSEELGYDPSGSLFFDIETTGLSASNSHIFLIGAVAQDSSGLWFLTTYFAEKTEEESSILTEFFTQVSTCHTLLHYNGSSFDLPFLMKRAEALDITCTLSSKTSLDLYRILRPVKKLWNLDHMKQKDLEHCALYQREDQLTGKHMISLYQKYITSREPGLKDLLLLHNHDDMIGMTKILPLCAFSMLLCGNISDHLTICFEEVPDHGLIFQIILPFRLQAFSPCEFEIDQLSCKFWYDGESLFFDIPFFQGTMAHFFPDYKNYYYLPLEDQAVHKSIAAFMDNAYRTKATASNCYIKKSGVFLPQYKETFTPAFRSEFSSGSYYMEYKNSLFDTVKREYLEMIFSHFV